MTGLVSVVIPAYNHEAFIEEAIGSVLEQTYPQIEIIVVDDGSRDRTAERARALRDAHPAKIELLVQENAGAHEAINVGLARARGAWLTVLNSDDAYAPSRIEKLVASCREARRGWGFTAITTIQETGVASDVGADTVLIVQKAIPEWPSLGFAFLQQNIAASTGNLFFSRELFQSVGKFAALQYLHDWDYALRLLLWDEPVFVDEPLYRYRIHGLNTFQSLGHVAARESNYVMRNFFLQAHIGTRKNPLVPAPDTWPGFFEEAIARINYPFYLPSAQELSFASRPAANDAPQASFK